MAIKFWTIQEWERWRDLEDKIAAERLKIFLERLENKRQRFLPTIFPPKKEKHPWLVRFARRLSL